MKISITRIFNWLIISIVIWVNANYTYWNDENRIIAWDIISYYGYLPATFIYHDVDLKFTDTAHEQVKSKIWYAEAENGGRVIKTSMGIAYLYAPFFFIAHAYATITGIDANGYNWPYRFMLIASCVFYLSFAIYFLRKTLCRFFSDWVVILTIIAIVLGTNLFYYSTTEPTMSHAYSFFLFSAFLYFTIEWNEKMNFKNSIIIGSLLGLISLARPTNAIIVLIFVLWDVKSFADFKKRFSLYLAHIPKLLVIACFTLLIWVPQWLYWKHVTDHWWYYSYGKERFFFNNPQIFNSLFSYRKGWLLYTPMMALALAGIPLLFKYLKAYFLPILIFTLLNIYIISSWWDWWYGGGFGLRAYIDSYALLSIPIALFISKLSEKKRIRKIGILTLVSLLVFFYQFQNLQYRSGAIHWCSMTKQSYWASFGKLTPPPNFQELLEDPYKTK